MLDAAHPIGQLTMSSLDARTIIFDLETVAWTQSGDIDSFTPSSELAVVPPVYDIAPFQRALVRIGLREKAQQLSSERAFQVRFREVLPSGATQTPRTLAEQVFVAPAERRGDVRYELQRVGSQQARISVQNDSNAHVYLGDIRIGSGDQVAYSGSLRAYVLAGNARTFTVPLAHPLEGDNAEMTIRNGQEETTVSASIR